MLGWLSELKRAIFKERVPEKTNETISDEVDSFFKKLVEVFPMQNKCHGRLEFLIGHYSFAGGWLSDSFYFDIYDANKEFKINKKGRVYIGKGYLNDSIKYVSHKCGEDNEVISSTVVERLQGLHKRDLVSAINFIIPNLIEE